MVEWVQRYASANKCMNCIFYHPHTSHQFCGNRERAEMLSKKFGRYSCKNNYVYDLYGCEEYYEVLPELRQPPGHRVI